MFPRHLVATACLLALSAAPAAARAPHSPAPLATGDPMPIGQVSHSVGPVGFIYTEAPGPAAAPLAARRHVKTRPVVAHKATTRRLAQH